MFETVLYGPDVRAVACFYREVIGLREIGGLDELGAAFRLPDGGVLLLFDPELASRPDRPVPAHGQRGPGHVAFSVAPGTLDRWRDLLLERGEAIERELTWGAKGRSLYLRDPAGNSVELVDGDIWPT